MEVYSSAFLDNAKKDGSPTCPSCKGESVLYTSELEFFICDSFLDGTLDTKYRCIDCGTYSPHDGLLVVMFEQIHSSFGKGVNFLLRKDQKKTIPNKPQE